MVRKFKAYLILMIFLICLAPSGFSQYAELVGKWAEIKAPQNLNYIGVALDEEACDRLTAILHYGDREQFKKLLKSYRILRIKNNTSVLVLETSTLEGKAKVVLLRGLHKDFSGWIPIEWLNPEQPRPLIPTYYKEKGRIYRWFPPESLSEKL